MGGSLAVTLREPDGTEHRMCRWMNMLPAFINNLKLVEQDQTHVAVVTKDISFVIQSH